MTRVDVCTVCGGRKFVESAVLWEELVNEWQLAPEEVEYINRQQGCCCASCGNNLRSLALAYAITRVSNFRGTLLEFVNSERSENIRILEINESGGLSPILRKLRLHTLVSYPAYDMTRLSLDADSFDIVVHSDTLEHICDPVLGLRECRRVLKSTGRCIYTIPIITGRMSRSRHGMKKSFHGSEGQCNDDYLVYTEFGADMWRFPIQAGFASVRIHSLEYPTALVIEAAN